MPHYLMVALMFIMTGSFVVIAAITAKKVTNNIDNQHEWFKTLLAVSLISDMILLTNALAFISQAEIASVINGIPSRSRLLQEQFSLLLGTASLMALVEMAIRDPQVLKQDNSDNAFSYAMMSVVERLLIRFWWAALGLGLLFGMMAQGVALLLAVELSLIWIIGRGALYYRQHKT